MWYRGEWVHRIGDRVFYQGRYRKFNFAEGHPYASKQNAFLGAVGDVALSYYNRKRPIEDADNNVFLPKNKKMAPLTRSNVQEATPGGRMDVDREGGANASEPSHITYHNQGVSHNRGTRGKHVHVAKRLRTAIKEVAEKEDEIPGKYKMVYGGQSLSCPLANRQYVMDGVGWSANAAALSTGGTAVKVTTPWLFNPEWFVHVASTLFYNKVPSFTVVDNDLLSTQNIPHLSQLSFRVKSSWATYDFKNVSANTVILKLYCCQPKRPGYCHYRMTYSDANLCLSDTTSAFLTHDPVSQVTAPSTADSVFLGGTGTSVATTNSNITPSYGPPSVCWSRALLNEKTAGTELSTSLDPTYLHLSPKECPDFNRQYDSELTEIVLEPGQTYMYKVSGPSDYWWSFEKHVRGGVIMNVQPYMRSVMSVIRMGQAKNVANQLETGRFADPKAVLSLERTYGAVIGMPETTGFKFPVYASEADLLTGISGKQFSMNLRRPRKFTSFVEESDLTGLTPSGAVAPYSALGV